MIIKQPLIIDLSAWEKDTFWDRQKDAPPLLMITRLTLGKAYVDWMATGHVDGARSIGSKVGVYHFLEYNDISTQVENFLNACRNRGYLVGTTWTLDVEPILDVEKEPVTTADPQGSSWANQVKVWLDLVEAATGKKSILYTNLNYWNQVLDRNGNPPSWTSDYKLWVAQYYDNPDLHETSYPLPPGWNDWYIWQYSAAGLIPLCPYDGVDLNKASAKLLEDLGQPPEIPPTGGNVYKYKLTGANPNSSFTNIRSDHSAASLDVGDFLNGSVAEGDTLWEEGSGTSQKKWLNIQTMNGQSKIGWVAVIYNGQTLCKLEENVVTPPPPPAGKILVNVAVDGVSKYSAEFPEGSKVSIEVS